MGLPTSGCQVLPQWLGKERVWALRASNTPQGFQGPWEPGQVPGPLNHGGSGPSVAVADAEASQFQGRQNTWAELGWGPGAPHIWEAPFPPGLHLLLCKMESRYTNTLQATPPMPSTPTWECVWTRAARFFRNPWPGVTWQLPG